MTASFYDGAYYSTGSNEVKTDRGTYRSLLELQTAVPIGTAGDYAKVDTLEDNAIIYLWDVDLNQWVVSGVPKIPTGIHQIAELNPSTDDFLQYKLGSWTNQSPSNVKSSLELDGEFCKAYLQSTGFTLAQYKRNQTPELWDVQDSLATHRLRITQWLGHGTTGSAQIGFNVPTYSGSTNTASVNNSSEWGSVPFIETVAGTSTISGVSFNHTTHQYHSNPENNNGHLVSHVFAIRDSGGGSLFNGARMFIGDVASTSAPTDVETRSLTNAIGVIQSPLNSNPNNLYFYINGTAATGYLVDTGLPVLANNGYMFLLIQERGTRRVFLRLTNLVNGASFTHVVDVTTLPTNQQMSSAMYGPRQWRSGAGTNSPNTRLGHSKIAVMTRL